MTLRNAAIVACAAILLAGCATIAPRAPLSAAERGAALARQQEREAALGGQADWNLAGRVALSNGTRGGSGRIEWRQRGAQFEVSLSAPVTRQGWRLTGGAGSARLEGLDGGPRSGGDPQALLRDATGWEIPVAALASWVRGARAPAGGAAELQFGGDGRLARLQQDGWTLDYAGWQLQPGLGVELPMRVTAERDSARIRLVVDSWQGGAQAVAMEP